MHDAKVATEGYFPLWQRATVKDDKDWGRFFMGDFFSQFEKSEKAIRENFG